MPYVFGGVACIKLPGGMATLTISIVLHIQCERAAGAPALHRGGLAEQEKAGCCRRSRMRPPSWLLGAPGCGLVGLTPRGSKYQVRAWLGLWLWGFVLVLLPPLCAFMAQRLGIHGHEERAVGRFAFYVHERQLGNGGVQRVQLSPPLLIVLLPLLVLVLDEFKVIIYQVYFLW